ncbi:hypothetical protein M407DRAFT_17421 [Tulasnella calospora MUT 4182]|uniref:Uncharacterized protein n=1 Tax=Tulasnella calospora MUT 4182 TaxID=1051891 RepID=A0A0C3LIM1_9AGAM|nr:hypothetical protein M407DRAFT_17421 [Tulasnella calospora MUT 4182]
MALPKRAAQCLASFSKTQIRSYADAPAWVATQHTLRVAPWDGFKSMAYVYATARELEKRFGPIDHIKIPRDSETHSYKGYAWMTFREPLPVSEKGRLPKELQNIVVKKPNVDVDRPGGPGLADFAGLLEGGSKRPESEWTQLKDAQDSPSTDLAYLDVRLELSSNALKIKPTRSRHISPDLAKSIASSFDMFTGFANKPTPTMEAMRKKWSKHLPPQPTSSKASASRHTAQKDTKKPAVASELPQMDPLADYLEAYKDLKDEPSVVANPQSTSPDPLPGNTETGSDGLIQVDQAQELRSGQGDHQEEVAVIAEETQHAGTSQSDAVAEFMAQDAHQSRQHNPDSTQADGLREGGKHTKEAKSHKPSRKDALLAAARKSAKKAEKQKLKPKSTESTSLESSTPEAASHETESESTSESSGGMQSRIFSMFKRS